MWVEGHSGGVTATSAGGRPRLVRVLDSVVLGRAIAAPATVQATQLPQPASIGDAVAGTAAPAPAADPAAMAGGGPPSEAQAASGPGPAGSGPGPAGPAAASAAGQAVVVVNSGGAPLLFGAPTHNLMTFMIECAQAEARQAEETRAAQATALQQWQARAQAASAKRP
jgi:hypothetical protein